MTGVDCSEPGVILGSGSRSRLTLTRNPDPDPVILQDKANKQHSSASVNS